LDAGFTYAQIALTLGVTLKTVQYTCQEKDFQVTPQHRNAGAPPILRGAEAQRVIDFIKRDKITRQMPATQICAELYPDEEVGVIAVRACLRRAGIKRRWAKKKPVISETNRRRRLQFAQEHLHWTAEDWMKVLWSDETWAGSGIASGRYVWCDDTEVWDDDCVIPRYQKKRKWMFWGSFYGNTKGPCFFWDRNLHGTIDQHSYIRHICPLVIECANNARAQGIDLTFMQDNAPSHSARLTVGHLRANGVNILKWPAYSPDLNPIEHLWAIMKDWIAEHYPEYTENQEENRDIVQEAWDSIQTNVLHNLAASMPARMRAVIDANGMHTRY
jgi:transposase